MTRANTPTPSSRSAMRAAVEVLAWAFAFYRRNLREILAISSVSAVARVVAVGWASLPAVIPTTLELVTLGARLLLLWTIFRRGLLADDRLRGLSSTEIWQRMTAFARTRWSVLLVHLALLAGAVAVFDIVPERIAVRWVPEEKTSAHMAALLAVKNLTVIAFTLIWMVGIVRQMILMQPGVSRRSRGPEQSHPIEADPR